MRIALYEPDIPQNTGTILRLCACLGIEAHIIEPSGFPVTDRAFRRAGMDYIDSVSITRHGSFAAFEEWRGGGGVPMGLFSTTGGKSLFRPPLTPPPGVFFCRGSAARPAAVPRRGGDPPPTP